MSQTPEPGNALHVLAGLARDVHRIAPVAAQAEALLAREPHLPQQAREHLAIIARTLDGVAGAVERMRDLDRTSEPHTTPAPLDVNALVPHAAALAREPIQVRMDLLPLLPDVLAIEAEVRTALSHLVANAVDAMPGGGTLTIRTRLTDEGTVELEVNDTGSGMDEETLRRCAEPFFTTKGERGTGLGLAMVREIAQRHKAMLTIDSVPGLGTSVRLYFPPMAAGASPGSEAANDGAPVWTDTLPGAMPYRGPGDEASKASA